MSDYDVCTLVNSNAAGEVEGADWISLASRSKTMVLSTFTCQLCSTTLLQTGHSSPPPQVDLVLLAMQKSSSLADAAAFSLELLEQSSIPLFFVPPMIQPLLIK